MTSVEIMLPDSLFAALRKAPHEVPREMRIAASIHWYQQSRTKALRRHRPRHPPRLSHLADQRSCIRAEDLADLEDGG